MDGGVASTPWWCAFTLATTPSMEDRMNRNKTIDYVEFHADNLPATRQFYSQVFGWEFEDYGPDYTSFKDGRIAGGFSRGPYLRGPDRSS